MKHQIGTMLSGPPAPMAFKLDAATIGARVKARRSERGLSQQQVAKACGLSQNSVGKIEQGRTENSRFISQIWAYLDLDLAELSDLYSKETSRRGDDGDEPSFIPNDKMIEVQPEPRKAHQLKAIAYEVVKFQGGSGRGILITWTALNGATVYGLMDRAMIADAGPEFYRCARALGIDLTKLPSE